MITAYGIDYSGLQRSRGDLMFLGLKSLRFVLDPIRVQISTLFTYPFRMTRSRTGQRPRRDARSEHESSKHCFGRFPSDKFLVHTRYSQPLKVRNCSRAKPILISNVFRIAKK